MKATYVYSIERTKENETNYKRMVKILETLTESTSPRPEYGMNLSYIMSDNSRINLIHKKETTEIMLITDDGAIPSYFRVLTSGLETPLLYVAKDESVEKRREKIRDDLYNRVNEEFKKLNH